VDQSIEKYKKWQPFLLGLCAVLGLWAGLQMRQIERPGVQDSNESGLHVDQSQKIKDVLSFVQSKYLDTIDPNLATDLALESLLASLDPYSEYIPSDLMHKYSDQIQGKLRGIGINFLAIDSQLVVSQVRNHSPAAAAGIAVGDYVLEIENHAAIPYSTNPDSIQDLIENHQSDSIWIKWKNRIHHQVHKSQIAIEELDEHPVTDAHVPVNHVLYLKLNQFSKDSYREFMNVVEHYFDSKNCRHLIIDLRDNTGGLIHEAAYILNQLISDKDLLMFRTAGNKIKSKEYKTTGRPFFKIEKIIVLVNDETASAAELMAAALQDLDRATIIGVPTFGKSTVLEQFSLGDGSAIRLAVSRFYTYSGRSIQKSYQNSSEVAYIGHSESESDSVYYSLKKKKLPAHQGVIPDIIVSKSSFNNSDQSSIDVITDYIIGKYFTDFQSMIQNNPDNINKNFNISELIKREVVKDSTNKYSAKLLEQECKYALARWFFSEELEHRMRLLDDEFLAIALKEIMNESKK
jgi:carboxyl-terminal processing protease